MSKSVVLSVGVFLLLVSVYTAAGPGRIDMIDGQYRFEVAHNLVIVRSTQIYDDVLPGMPTAADGRHYSPYGVASSILPLPLVLLARATASDSIEREHFFFSLTSGIFAAATAALLLQFYLALGVSASLALIWTLVFALATSMLPAATTVFDQAQHAFFVLAACFLIFIATRRDSLGLAIAAGMAMVVAVSLKEVYVALVPAIAWITLSPRDATPEARRRSLVRAGTFAALSSMGLLLWVIVNYLRFADPLSSVKASASVLNPIGNPAVGLAGLLISPGKGVLLYSPATVLGLFGLPRLLERERRLGEGIVAASVVHVLGMSSLSFFAGDWCWGPRYLVPVLPLLALGLPMIRIARAWSGRLVWAVVAASFMIQIMGISIDHHRFFYRRSLRPFFWYENAAFYFRESALFSRPGELLESFRNGVPAEADRFRPGPHPNLLTYAVFGPPRLSDVPQPLWMRRYRVFWLPRPWPLWMTDVARDRRPVDVQRWLLLLAATAGIGLVAVGRGLGYEAQASRLVVEGMK